MEEISSGDYIKAVSYRYVYSKGHCTHKLLGLTTVLDLDVGLASLREDLEGEVLHIRLDLSIIELAADEALCVEDGVVRVHRDLVLRGIANETLGLGEGDVGWCCAVTLVVGDDLNTIILPDTDTAKES